MKKYKIILRGMGIFATGIKTFPKESPEPTLEQIENEVALYLNEKLLKAWINNEDWLLGRLIINPHSSYFSKEAFKEMRKKAAENAFRIVKNQIPLNVIK